MPVLLTFGDSNTYGAVPRPPDSPVERFAPDVRWPGVCLAALGPGWTLIEEGLPGRTFARPDPLKGPHMDGRVGLMIALESHGPIDVMTLMLGTNDLKVHFGMTAAGIAADAGALLDMSLADDVQDRHGGFEVLLVCPPPVIEVPREDGRFAGAHARSLALPALYRAEAEARQVAFLDAGQVVESSPVDGIHLDAPAHGALGRAIADAVRALA